MKLDLYFNKISLIVISLSLLTFSIETMGNISTKDEVKKITSKLRCMTCQNQTIYDSDAEFSINIKKIVRQKLENREKEEEIINFLIQRYGEYIVFEPQMNKHNLFLWYFPFIILAISLVFFIFRIKKN